MDEENTLELPLLTEKQRKFLERVQSINNDIISRCTTNIPTNPEAMEEVLVKLAIIKENIDVITRQLNTAPNSRRNFIDSYSKWIEARRESISHLKKIVENMRNKKFLFNLAKVSSSSVNLLAGGMILFGNEDLFNTGTALTAASCTASLGALYAELKLLRDNIEKAKIVLEKDRECLQEFVPWLDRAEKLENALHEILEMDIVKQIFEHVQHLVHRGMEIYEEKERLEFVREKILDIVKSFSSNANQCVPEYVLPVLITALTTIFLLMSDEENRLTFDCASIAVKGFFDVARLTCYFTDLSILSEGLPKPVFKGITAMGMVVDSTIIIVKSIEISKGSVCPQADKIAKAAKSLEDETERMETIYKDTKNILNQPFS